MNKMLLVLIAITLSVKLFAQEEINHDVVVIKSYSPVIGDAQKLSDSPQIVDTAKVDVQLKYDITAIPFSPNYIPKPIQPVSMVGEPLNKLYHHYVLAGFGNYTKPVFEYRYGTDRSKELLGGFNFKHISQHGNLKIDGTDKKQYSGYSYNMAQAYIHRMFKKTALETDLTYRRYANHYYGHNAFVSDTLFDKTTNKQAFSWMNATARYKSTSLNPNDLYYNFAMDYNYYEDQHSNFLNDFGINAIAQMSLNNERIGLEFDYRYYNHLSPVQLFANSIYHLNPFIKKSNKNWGIEAGLNIDVDANNDSTTFHYYPKIKLYYNVIDYFLVPYLSISGEKQSQNYRKITLENAFVKPNLVVRNVNELIALQIGFRGNFTSTLSYNISGKYRVIDDAHFFVNDSTNLTENQFVVEYDDVERYDIDAEMTWIKSKKLRFNLLAQYHGFKLDEIEYAWHVPDYEVHFSTNYNIQSKIIVDFDVFVLGQRYAKTYYKEGLSSGYSVVKVPETLDFNLGAEYRYTQKWSAFVRFNNILARKNYLWNYYPTEGFNATLGIIYSF